jgi:hypothetical protein
VVFGRRRALDLENLRARTDSSKRLDHFVVEKLLLCHPGNLLVEGEAFHDPANILREPTDVAVEVRNQLVGVIKPPAPRKPKNPKIVFGKAFFLGHNARTVNGATTNRRKRADAQSSGPLFAARKSFFAELEKRLSNLAEAKGVAVKVKLLRSVGIGPNAPRASSGYLNWSCKPEGLIQEWIQVDQLL